MGFEGFTETKPYTVRMAQGSLRVSVPASKPCEGRTQGRGFIWGWLGNL